MGGFAEFGSDEKIPEIYLGEAPDVGYFIVNKDHPVEQRKQFMLKKTESGNIEKTFNDIVIGEKTGIDDNVRVLIRDTYIPFLHKPVAVVDCKCGESYKKKLFYLSAHGFSIDEKLKCRNPECGHEITLHYSSNPDP